MSWTREEFDNITSWWELRNVCDEYDVDADSFCVQEIYDVDGIADHIRDLASDYMWGYIYRAVCELMNRDGEDGEAFYMNDDEEFRMLDVGDMETAKEEILENLHSRGIWLDGELDDEEDDDNEEEYEGGGVERATEHSIYRQGTTKSLYGDIVIGYSSDSVSEDLANDEIDMEQFELMLG